MRYRTGPDRRESREEDRRVRYAVRRSSPAMATMPDRTRVEGDREAADDQVPTGGALRLPWRRLAISSLLFNLIAVVCVATVASVTDAGALNTVALALSILAFVSQLIMYSLQSWQSGEQLRQARELNGATQAVLS